MKVQIDTLKIKELLIISALGFAACCSGFSAIAQENSVSPADVADVAPATDKTPAAVAQAPAPPKGSAAVTAARAGHSDPPKTEKIATLRISAGDLGQAVEAVQNQWKEPLNVIFSGETQTQPVPSLTLRSVTGPDALMLVSAAANVPVQPILGLLDGDIIGYAFDRPKFAPGALGGGNRGNPLNPVEAKTSGRAAGAPDESGFRPAPPVPGLPSQIQTYPTVGSDFGGLRSNVFRDAGPFGGNEYGDSEPADDSAVSTRVYPLAAVTASLEFDEVEGTLLALLETEGIARDGAKLSFHQETGVLVLRAPEEVQRLVQELLRALAQNSTETREMNATRELAQMQAKIKALSAERELLQNRSEEAEAVARKYQNELHELRKSQQDNN